MSIIDRYVMRQVLMPFLLGLLVFTFIFTFSTNAVAQVLEATLFGVVLDT